MNGERKSTGYPFWKEFFIRPTYLERSVYLKKKNFISKYSNNLDSQILGPSIINYEVGSYDVPHYGSEFYGLSKEEKYLFQKIKFDEDKRYVF